MAFWPIFIAKHYKYICPFLSKDIPYISANVTRFYFEKKDKTHCAEQLASIKQIWQGREVVIVEGVETRSGIGNDLYDNATSLWRILGPATNAFDMYDKMLETIIQHVSKDKLILLCYGMTATVLAYDLAKLGYWAIDLGHLDIEYEWFKLGITKRIAIKGKFTNEVSGGNKVEECTDPKYLSQIICDITK